MAFFSEDKFIVCSRAGWEMGAQSCELAVCRTPATATPEVTADRSFLTIH